jgi:hypothetical protein
MFIEIDNDHHMRQVTRTGLGKLRVKKFKTGAIYRLYITYESDFIHVDNFYENSS